MKYIIFLFFLFIIVIFIIINKFLKIKTVENYCKVPYENPEGTINDKRVNLDDFKPQTDIITSSCDKYWKDWPLEVNNTLVENNPIVIDSDQLELPKEKQFADNNYIAGLIDFKKLGEIVSEKISFDILKNSKELLIDPETLKELEYKYELEFAYLMLNKKTYINRWQKYNPSVKTEFDYNDIKSPIEKINILNKVFKEKCDIMQRKLLTKEQLILFGLIPFQIFKYRILSVKYIDGIITKPVYIIEIALFRESDYYLNTLAYVGFFENDSPVITKGAFIGRNSTDDVLLSDYYNPNEITQEIINKNFWNSFTIDKDPNSIANLQKKYEEGYKLKNQYACFNIDYEGGEKDYYILPYISRESCESSYDAYGKKKSVGIYDTPCKKDEECPFFQINQNYENNYGKCMESGYCELPINMKPIGYHYFKNNDSDLPLCYNCDSKKEFNVSTNMDSCCDEQYDKKKYPFLKSPDYAFLKDSLERTNYFNQKFCKSKPNSLSINCDKIVL